MAWFTIIGPSSSSISWWLFSILSPLPGMVLYVTILTSYWLSSDSCTVQERLTIRRPRRRVSVEFRPRSPREPTWILFYRITSIILSRFIIDLRQNVEEHSSSVSNHGTLEFAQKVEDGLGGTVRSIWGSGTHEDWNDDEGVPLPEYSIASSGERVVIEDVDYRR